MSQSELLFLLPENPTEKILCLNTLNSVFTMEEDESLDRSPPMQTILATSELKNSDRSENNLDSPSTMEEEDSPERSPGRRHLI